MKRDLCAMVVSWDSSSYSHVLLTEQLFRVKEIDYISTLCPFANTISYRSCIRFLQSSIFLNIAFIISFMSVRFSGFYNLNFNFAFYLKR